MINPEYRRKLEELRALRHRVERIISQFDSVVIDEWSSLDLFSFRAQPTQLDVCMSRSTFGGSPFESLTGANRRKAKQEGWTLEQRRAAGREVNRLTVEWTAKCNAHFRKIAPGIRLALRKEGIVCQPGIKKSCFDRDCLRVGSFMI